MRKRRHRNKPPRPKQVEGALIVVKPGPGVVQQAAAATANAREIAEAKRAVERGLRNAGLSRRQSEVIVARMSHRELQAEADRIRAAESPPPVTTPPSWLQRLKSLF